MCSQGTLIADKARDLLRLEVFKPEFVVSVLKMGTLISAIAMHTVRIDHEVELLSGLVKGIKKLESILMMLTMSREF